jgi:hypothetical protein
LMTDCLEKVTITDFGADNGHTYTYGKKKYPVREGWAGLYRSQGYW